MNSAVFILEQAAEKYGDKTAVKDENTSITYAQLRDKSRRIGTCLQSHLPKIRGQVSPVVILMKKSVEAVIAFMGVLYSGNPYVPLDYEIPPSRLDKVLENLNPSFIITDEAGKNNFKADAQALVFSEIVETKTNEAAINEVLENVTDTEPIYVMYTSGSTGTPKGVVIPHNGVIDYAYWVRDTFNITPSEVMGSQAPFYFDNSVLDIYGAFASGATLVLMPNVLFQFPAKIPEYINETGITFVFFVPTVMINIANCGVLADVNMPLLKKVLFCGEEMPTKQLNIWRKHMPDALYANLYGPTEITDVCTYYIVDRDFDNTESLPIGKPCKNMNAIILTDENKLAKTAEQGELCILGTGLSVGYWGAKELTDKVFVQNPTNTNYNEPMYKTGDLVYMGEDGLLRFVGRKDSQIKLRGNRIELGDIESAVKNIENVENACVIFDAEAQEIVVFIQSATSITLHQLKRKLMEQIPKYMVPSRVKIMDKLPLTPNDKIDRVKLKGLINHG